MEEEIPRKKNRSRFIDFVCGTKSQFSGGFSVGKYDWQFKFTLVRNLACVECKKSR